MENLISSTSNPYVKHLKKLQTSRKYRETSGSFVLEGERPVKDMLSYGITPIKLILSEKHPSLSYKCETLRMTDNVMKYISDTESPQGIMAEVEIPKSSLSDISPETVPFVLFSDGISDPGNLGTIIRTLDAVSRSAIVLGTGTVDLYNPKTVRSTMSSLFNVPSFVAYDNKKALVTLKKMGYKILGTRMENAENYTESDFSEPVVVIMGSEAFGISRVTADMCDGFVKIPIEGKIESLNVAVAAAIISYEALRKRKKQ
ncbi:MAG: RNA methyltransferase [Ruminococcaceae bacterium]|nr:RNA methyltransferase [Oscillospiraceae bacterium]